MSYCSKYAAFALILLAAVIGSASAQTPYGGGGGGGGGGTGCNTSGSSGSILTDDGAGGCADNTTDSGALSALGHALNGSSGLLAFSKLGTSGATIPLLNGANTWSGVQSFTDGDLSLSGSSSGASVLHAPSTGGGAVTLPPGSVTLAATNTVNTFTSSQRAAYQTPTISTATFTPAVASGNNIRIGLTSACPCTLANFSGTLVAGQQGVIEIAQDGTGSRTIGTWGSAYVTAGGTSTITLSTAASTVDYLPYAVDSTATHVVLGALIAGPTH